MPETVQPSIERARSRLETERRFLERERDAFSDLLGRINTIPVDAPAAIGSQTNETLAASTMATKPQSAGLRRVRELYRETVMAVPHYEAEYDESLAENLAVECGPTIANQLVDGDALTQPVYDAFVGACRRARKERKGMLQHLASERESLARYESELDEIESAVFEAAEQIESQSESQVRSRIDETFSTLQARCSALSAERQQEIHDWAARDIEGTELGLLEYLYGDLPTTTPVLSDIVSCLETIHYHRRRCLR